MSTMFVLPRDRFGRLQITKAQADEFVTQHPLNVIITSSGNGTYVLRMKGHDLQWVYNGKVGDLDYLMEQIDLDITRDREARKTGVDANLATGDTTDVTKLVGSIE